jgi:hypothetical protein
VRGEEMRVNIGPTLANFKRQINKIQNRGTPLAIFPESLDPLGILAKI